MDEYNFIIDLDLTEMQETSYQAIKKQSVKLKNIKCDSEKFLSQVLVMSELLELYVGSRSIIDLQLSDEDDQLIDIHCQFLTNQIMEQLKELSPQASQLLKRCVDE